MPIANNQTYSTKQSIKYSDFPDNFNKAPFSSDLALVTNENSVKQSIRNIVLTIASERPYDNTIGSAGQYGLFGIDDSLTSLVAVQTIKDALKQNEPRAAIIQVLIDNETDTNAYTIQIIFQTVASPSPSTVNILVRRVR